tara:strand:+ start:2226 stop:4664 length:2439 start_codon:yes stop_codon:yes gene_type:complete
MAIEPSLYQAPTGIGSLDAGPDIEVELLDPEDAGVEISLTSEEEPETAFDANLAEDMSEGVLQTLAGDLLGDYDADLNSRKDWLDTYTKGLKLLGLKYEERSQPWPGACGVFHPLLMESAVKFQAETIMETFPAMGPVKTKIVGKETPEKKDASIRVADDMNYELTEVMKEYRPEHERMLISLCLSGNAFKKIYYDPSIERQVAMFVPAEDIIVPYGASSLESAERVTHKMRKTKNEVLKLQVAKFYRDTDLGEPMAVMDQIEKQKATEQGLSTTIDDRYQLLEMHVNLNLPGHEDVDDDNNETGIELPYVVTLDKGTSTVLAIRRNWLEDDKLKTKRQHFVHYGYIPGFGFYYFGLIHLIGGHSQAATSLLRQLIDAGTLSNLPGGLKARGLRIKGDDTPIAPGEFRDVDLPSGSIRDNILPLPYKEPSQTLSLLMDKVVEDGRRFAAVADLKVSDMSAQSPVGTTLAILERVLKVMSAVQARIYYTMKQEFKLLALIIKDNTPDSYSYEPEVGNKTAKKSDYDMVDVIPVSDPNASTMSQRVVQYQAVLQLSQTAPQIYDLPFLHRQMIETLGVKNASKIVPVDEDMKPVDPVSENMAILNGKPVKAFIGQDHEAHLMVHTSFMQDPKIAAQLGQNPAAQALLAAAQAHVMEHVAYQYRRDIEKQLGAALPPQPTEDGENILPDHVEVELSQLAAQAAAKLLQKDVAEAQAAQAAQAAQDPLVQMQQQDMQIKQQEAQRKTAQMQMDSKIKTAEQRRKVDKDQHDFVLRAKEIEIKEKEAENRSHTEGVRMGIDIGKTREASTRPQGKNK